LFIFGGATLFFRGGLGTPDASFFRAELGGGLVFEGALVKADAVGFAAFAARGSEVPLWETAYELTYKVPAFRGLAFQPFLMWIDQPLQGESSPALGLRLDLHLWKVPPPVSGGAPGRLAACKVPAPVSGGAPGHRKRGLAPG